MIRNNENVSVRNIGQGEARRKTCKRLKLCGGQAYDHSNVQAVVIFLGSV